jgi:hypothetical protein
MTQGIAGTTPGIAGITEGIAGIILSEGTLSGFLLTREAGKTTREFSVQPDSLIFGNIAT